jgi:transposase
MEPKMSRTSPEPEWPLVSPDAAGLDIGASEIWACVPAGRATPAVRCFATFTPDLEALADWLQACGMRTVAMESTGVYWVPVFELLEARGFEVYLVNAQHIKNVPGRKSDIQDCQWIQRLHSYGFLRASFRPEAEMAVLRSYLRHRTMLIEHRAAHIQHMQKALQLMNLQLPRVLSDITGITGMQIIRAIVRGERDPKILATYRHGRCQHSEAEIAKALTGNYRAEHVFALKQALALYDAYTEQLQACDAEIERQYAAIRPRFDPEAPDQPLGPDPKPETHSKNGPQGDIRCQLFKLIGVDLTAIAGVDQATAQILVSEIGTDMSKWRTEKHFCSWLGVAPHNDITGGRIVRSRTLPTHNRAAQALRLAAQSAGRGQSALGAFYRRLRARVGPEQATTATAHKIARIVYHMIKHRQPYYALSAAAYDTQQQQRELKSLQRRAAKLGMTLTPNPA